jgi:hypothetical protein
MNENTALRTNATHFIIVFLSFTLFIEDINPATLTAPHKYVMIGEMPSISAGEGTKAIKTTERNIIPIGTIDNTKAVLVLIACIIINLIGQSTNKIMMFSANFSASPKLQDKRKEVTMCNLFNFKCPEQESNLHILANTRF